MAGRRAGRCGRGTAGRRAGVLSLLAAAALACSGCGGGTAAAGCRGCNAVVVLLDAARADHFGFAGYERATTPRIDAMAANSLVFEHAVSNASFTIASVASLFTALAPAEHGVVGSGSVLPARANTLAEVLEDAGYRTGAFTENPLIDPDYGYAQGFDDFRDYFSRAAGSHGGRDLDLSQSREHIAEAVDWIDRGDPDRPFFLYVHLLRPHNPYHPLPVCAGRFTKDAADSSVDGSTAELRRLALVGADAADLDRLVALYDENLCSADALVGQLLDALRKRSLLDDTVVALVGDHGEPLGGHGHLLHGFHVYQEDVRIPLLIRLPDAMRLRGRLATRVRLSDLMPTLLSVLEVHPSVPIPGRALIPPPERPARPLVEYSLLERSIRMGDLEYVRGAGKQQGAAEGRLFDLARDPHELHDLAKARPEDAQRLRERLGTTLDQQWRRSLGSEEHELDAQRIERLRALGYLDDERS